MPSLGSTGGEAGAGKEPTTMSEGVSDADPIAVQAGHGDADPTAVLAAHWNESERRLYPTATTNPDAYQSAVKLVRAVADALADVSDLGELVQRWEHRTAVLDAAVRATGETVAYGLIEATAGCGFAIRRRELLNERAERERRERITAARDAGETWVVIHEQGDLASGLADPCQCMEMHLPTGLAVVSMVEPDPSTMTPVYVVTVTAMGAEAAGTSGIDLSSFEDLETADPELFEDNRRAMRSRVEAAGA
ncbi:MAG: hypothetical protein F4110_00460 [Acidimicrobiaceae bacterium]|nr:hypothetical protein [Acidimicrobiaceae bacterium]MXZ98989.1 hypothetical protein [Acidimicrobiaceae bacterium]MYE76295.1 hypothetical protein [Acidimicrobiaceae bacterium]MYE97416.1 hypothetical protein [Acidimicrobiaceae bacterium]MYH44714.1 hypothetical protein [Acidimicrobiaceae bacterium]